MCTANDHLERLEPAASQWQDSSRLANGTTIELRFTVAQEVGLNNNFTLGSSSEQTQLRPKISEKQLNL